jgi:hypothetical protein
MSLEKKVELPNDRLSWQVAKLLRRWDCSTASDCNTCCFNNYGPNRGKFENRCALNVMQDICRNYAGSITEEEITAFMGDGIKSEVEHIPFVIVAVEDSSDKVCTENQCNTCPIAKQCRKEILGEKA